MPKKQFLASQEKIAKRRKLEKRRIKKGLLIAKRKDNLEALVFFLQEKI